MFSDHPINPPEASNPWNAEFLPNCGYKIKLEKGVYKIFKTEEDLKSNKPIPYEVTNFKKCRKFPLNFESLDH